MLQRDSLNSGVGGFLLLVIVTRTANSRVGLDHAALCLSHAYTQDLFPIFIFIFIFLFYLCTYLNRLTSAGTLVHRSRAPKVSNTGRRTRYRYRYFTAPPRRVPRNWSQSPDRHFLSWHSISKTNYPTHLSNTYSELYLPTDRQTYPPPFNILRGRISSGSPSNSFGKFPPPRIALRSLEHTACCWIGLGSSFGFSHASTGTRSSKASHPSLRTKPSRRKQAPWSDLSQKHARTHLDQQLLPRSPPAYIRLQTTRLSQEPSAFLSLPQVPDPFPTPHEERCGV